MKRSLAIALLALCASCASSDFSQGRPYLCDRSDAGSCLGGWKCGVDSICHPPSGNGAIGCQVDPDCDPGWLCGSGGTCANPAGDALSATAYDGPLAAQFVSPALFHGPPEAFSATPQYIITLPDAGLDGVASFAYVADAGLWQVTTDAWPQYPLFSWDPSFTQVVHMPIPQVGAVAAAASLRERVYVLDNIGMLVLTPSDGGATRWAVPAGADRLRIALENYPPSDPSSPSPLVIAFGDRAYSVWASDIDAGSGVSTIRALDGGAQRLFDFSPYLTSTYGARESLWAAAEEGLFYANARGFGFVQTDGGETVAKPDFRPYELPLMPNAQCSGPSDGGFRPITFYWGINQANAEPLAVIGAPIGEPYDGTNAYLLSYGVSQSLPSQVGTCPTIPLAGFWMPNKLDYGPCPVCNAGERFISGHAVLQGNPATLASFESWCELADGGTATYRQNIGFSSCMMYPSFDVHASGHERLTSSASQTALGAAVGSHGHLWYGGTYDLSPLVMDLPIQTAVRGGPNLLAFSNTDPGNSLPMLQQGIVIPSQGFQLTQPFGLTRIWDQTSTYLNWAPMSSVEGRPEWALVGLLSGYQILEFSVADLERSPNVFFGPRDTTFIASNEDVAIYTPPFNAAVAPLPNGGSELVVSANDALFSADVTAAEADGGTITARLEPRLVPLARSKILSLAILPPSPAADGGSLLVNGYAVTPSNLFHVTASTQSRWQSEDVLMPTGDFLQVWNDGARARVGYRDGTVYGLPSRLPLSQGLPYPVQRYAQLCGRSYALTQGGLYALDPVPGANVGAWTPIPLDAVLPGGAFGNDLSQGMLHVWKNELYVFSTYGVVGKLVAPPCP